MKETYYFPHDYNAFSDEKMVSLRRQLGLEGYGIYWALCERIVNSSEGRVLLSDLENIAFDMHIEKEKLDAVIKSFGLFKMDSKYFWTKRLLEFFRKKAEKSSKAAESAKIRWADEPVNDADAMRSLNESNADAMQRKERKGKKVKETKETTNVVGEAPAIYGNDDVNKILKAIKLKVGIDDFSDSQKWQRSYGKHCFTLMTRISPQEFERRLGLILRDSFKRKRCNEIKYVYDQIKGFIEPNLPNNLSSA